MDRAAGGPGPCHESLGPDLDRAGRSRKELREKGPPRVLEPLKDVVLLMEGGAAKLTCRVSAFPDLFIRWGKDRKELRDGPKCRYVFKDPDVVALVVHDGELADLSRYSVTVTNPFGQCSDSARILVEGATRPGGSVTARSSTSWRAPTVWSCCAYRWASPSPPGDVAQPPHSLSRRPGRSAGCARTPFLTTEFHPIQPMKSAKGFSHAIPGPQGHCEPEAEAGLEPWSSGSQPRAISEASLDVRTFPDFQP